MLVGALVGLAVVLAAGGLQEDRQMDGKVRCVLEGLPRVGFYDGKGDPEDDLFPSAIKSFLQWKGEDLGFDDGRPKERLWHDVHMYLLGTTGSAFRMGWRAKKWDMAATTLFQVSKDPLKPFINGFDSAGYECRVELRKAYADQLGLSGRKEPAEADWKRLIVESIRDKKRPVLGIGIVGPPEVCLITGYDEGGDVLIGWSGFQADKAFGRDLETEKSGYFRKRNWFADAQGIVLIGEPKPALAKEKAFRKALKYGLELMREPKVRGFKTGFASFTAWADELLMDGLFEKGDELSLKERHEVHHATAGALAEARAYGSDFLHFAADALPKARNELLEAARCFSDEHDLVWAIWEFTGGWQAASEGGDKFGSAYIRGRLVPLIRLARERDVQAAEHIEKALRLLGDKPDAKALVLNDVPKIGYGEHLCPLPGSIFALMQSIGDPVEYDFLMGVSGAAFRRIWNRDDGGNVDLMYLSPEPQRRLFDALNYEFREYAKGGRDSLIEPIRKSLEMGRPVIAFGLIGPPEAGLVTGYENGGDVLRGWSYFGDGSKGYNSIADWDKVIGTGSGVALLTVGDKRRWPGPSKREILVSSLKWAIDLARTAKRPGLPKHVCGLAAYEAWAKALEKDGDYPSGDAKTMETRAMVHGDQCVMLEERRNAAAFLRKMADAAPEVADHLKSAADRYDEVASEGASIWPSFSMSYSDPKVWAWLADSANRRQVAAHVRAAMAKEAEAVSLLEAALERIGAH